MWKKRENCVLTGGCQGNGIARVFSFRYCRVRIECGELFCVYSFSMPSLHRGLNKILLRHITCDVDTARIERELWQIADPKRKRISSRVLFLGLIEIIPNIFLNTKLSNFIAKWLPRRNVFTINLFGNLFSKKFLMFPHWVFCYANNHDDVHVKFQIYVWLLCSSRDVIIKIYRPAIEMTLNFTTSLFVSCNFSLFNELCVDDFRVWWLPLKY